MLVALGTILFVAALFFTPPSVLESIDYVLFYKANFQFLLDAVSEGRLPLWNPYIGLGRPYLADIQNAVFYPPLYLVCLGKGMGVFLLIWLHWLLALFGMRALGARLGTGKWQGWLAAFCFAASLAITGRLFAGQILYCCGLSYVPLLFALACGIEKKWDRRVLAAYAVCLALQFLCGHPQVFWFSTIGQAAFVFFRCIGAPVVGSLRNLRRGLLGFGLALIWCAGLVAVALLPFLELVGEGNRQDSSPLFAAAGKLRGSHLLTVFSIFLGWSWEDNLFIGLPMFVAGLAGLLDVRDRNVRGLLGCSMVVLLIGLGDSTRMFDLFYRLLPGYSSFRLHVRMGVLVVFALLCSAGIWLSKPHPWLRALLNANTSLTSKALFRAFIFLQCFHLGYANLWAKASYSFSNMMQRPAAHPFQWQVVSELRAAGLLEPGKPPPRLCVPWSLVPANYGMIHHYSNFDAYTSLFLRRPWHYIHAMLDLTPPEIINTSVSEHVYDHGPFPLPDLALAAGATGERPILVLNTNPAPRAFVVYSAEMEGDEKEVLRRLRQGHDVYRSALIEKPLAKPLAAENVPPGNMASIRQFSPNSLLVDVDAKQRGLLVLAEAWYPGWKAEINGTVSEALPANGWMRAFPVSPGHYSVRVFFRQNNLVGGMVVSLLSVAALLWTCKRRPE
jgi:hypothetical protein